VTTKPESVDVSILLVLFIGASLRKLSLTRLQEEFGNPFPR
jgi:hypothetical protein